MSKGKYPSIFSLQMEAIVFNKHDYAVSKIGGYSQIFPSFPVLAGNIRSRDAFRPIAHEQKYLMYDNENICNFT